MGSVRVWVLIFITTSVSKGELVALKGYDLVYKLENSDVPRALLVNDLGNLVQSVATDAFTTCLFVKLDNYNGLTEVYLFSFSSQENHKVDEIVLRLDCVRHLLILYVHGLGYSSSVPTALDEWTHICVSWESNGGIVNMHVNAVRVGNGGLVHPGYILGGQGYFILGQYQDSFNGSSHPDTGVHGKITQFNLWNRVLTTDEALQSCITQAPGVAQPRTFCPPAFTIIHGRCYYFSQEIKNNWDEASRLCQELDPRGVLANIETAQEWEFLKTYLIEKELTSKNWWLGGSDRDDEGHWTWRGTNQPFAYDAWCLGQPDNARGNENCLHVMNATFPLCWNDIHCTHNPFGYHLNFICEI